MGYIFNTIRALEIISIIFEIKILVIF